MARSTDEQEKRLAELKKEVTKRGFDRHASVLKSIAELPSELHSSTVMEIASGETIQTIIYFPPQIHRGWYYIPKQALLFTSTNVIHLLASIWPDQQPQVTHLKGCGLMYMKVTLILLYGFLEIVTQGQDLPARLGMEFNTVAWNRLSSSLQPLLQAAKTAPAVLANKGSYSSSLRKDFERLPLKFSNGVQIYGLLPGEELEELVFQPAMWERWLYFFRRPIIENTLLLLSTNYMVVIQEEVGVGQGWILSYIPRSSIAGMQNKPCDSSNELSVRLKRSGQSTDYKLILGNEVVEAWRRQWIQRGGSWEDLTSVQQA